MNKNTTRKTISIIGIIVGIMSLAVLLGACDNGTTDTKLIPCVCPNGTVHDDACECLGVDCKCKQKFYTLISGITLEDTTGTVTNEQVTRLITVLTEIQSESHAGLLTAISRNAKVIIVAEGSAVGAIDRQTIHVTPSLFDQDNATIKSAMDNSFVDIGFLS